MIPKIIHFCWLSGDPYPEKIQKCIDSWKTILPDYEIWLWDTNRFDINSSIYVKEAFEKKNYAFCSDYIRCYALYHYGGVYLDSDVEVLKSYNNLLSLPYFIGMSGEEGFIEPATCGFEKGSLLLKKMLEYFDNRHFIFEDGTIDTVVLPRSMTLIAKELFEFKVINVKDEFDYSSDVLNLFNQCFFSPIDARGFDLKLTDDTYSIHHYTASWHPDKSKYRVNKIKQLKFIPFIRLRVFIANCITEYKFEGMKKSIGYIFKVLSSKLRIKP